MTAGIEVITVRRYRCTYCSRTASRPIRAREHMARCWLNPDNHGCKTCRHADSAYYVDGCQKGVDLTGHPPCAACGGWGMSCEDCGGKDPEVKPGPILHCPLWETRDGAP